MQDGADLRRLRERLVLLQALALLLADVAGDGADPADRALDPRVNLDVQALRRGAEVRPSGATLAARGKP